MNEIKINRNLLRYVVLGLGFVGLLVMAFDLLQNLTQKGSPLPLGTVGWVGLLGAAACAAGFIVLDPQALVRTATGRSGQYALTSVLMSAAAVVVVVVVYLLIQKVNPSPADLTQLQKNTVTAKTAQMLAGLTQNVHAVGAYTASQDTERKQAETWLSQYAKLSNGKITYEFVDPDRDKQRATQLGVTRSGTVVFTRGDQKAEAASVDEQGLTNALVRVLTGKQRIAYLINGHGERAADDYSGNGLSQVSTYLDNANIKLQPLNILEKKGIPDDADLIVVAGPTSQYSPAEVDDIKAFLAKGKGALFMFEPGRGGGTLGAGVLSATFSPDGAKIVTAGADGTAQVWDTATGKNLAVLRGHAAEVRDAVFSPDGKQIATASLDGTVRVWDAASGQQIAKLTGQLTRVRRVAYSPDGRYLVSIGEDQNVNVWTASDDKPTSYSPVKLNVPLIAMAFAPDSATFAVTGGGDSSGQAGSQSTLFILDTATGNQLQTKPLPTNTVIDLTYSADGKTIYAATVDGTFSTIDVAKFEVKSAALYPSQTGISSFTMLPDASKEVFALGDGTIHIHDAKATTTDQDVVLKEHTGLVWQVSVSPDGKTLVSAGHDGTARVWTVGQTASTFQLKGHSGTDPLLAYLTSDWGIAVDDDVVVDLIAPQNGLGPYNPAIYEASQYGSSPVTTQVTSPFKQLVFGPTRSLTTASTPPSGVTLTPLVTSANVPGETWGETNPPSDRDPQPTDFDPKTDKAGPVTMGASAENSTTNGRIVVFGNVDFATDTGMQNTTRGNADLVIGAANWLSAREDAISLPSTNIGARTIDKPLDTFGFILLLVGTCLVVPGGLIVGGIVVTFVRRSRR